MFYLSYSDAPLLSSADSMNDLLTSSVGSFLAGLHACSSSCISSTCLTIDLDCLRSDSLDSVLRCFQSRILSFFIILLAALIAFKTVLPAVPLFFCRAVCSLTACSYFMSLSPSRSEADLWLMNSTLQMGLGMGADLITLVTMAGHGSSPMHCANTTSPFLYYFSRIILSSNCHPSLPHPPPPQPPCCWFLKVTSPPLEISYSNIRFGNIATFVRGIISWMQRSLQLPNYPTAREFSISPEGLQKLLSRPADPLHPHRNIVWTDDFRTELPIRVGLSGPSSFRPTTLIDEFHRVAREFGQRKALSFKRGGQWHSLTYEDYYAEAMRFAKALIAFKLEEFSAVNIIGFNAPEWSIAFFGSLFARCVPVGIYTTSNAATCEYIATHSDARMVLAENREQAAKYYPLLERGAIELIVVYGDPEFREGRFAGKVVQYEKFMAEGARVENRFVEQRISEVKPGHCCTLVYTSGTTGMPKGAMISHDNYVWTKKSLDAFHDRDKTVVHRMVSYLPLSHVAGQFADIVGSMMEGVHVFFAEPSALQGTLIQTLLEVKPTMFFSVPRVWEKIYDKMMEIARQNGPIKSRIAAWAKGLGPEGTIKEMRGEETSFAFKVAKTLIFNNVKKALGLDECTFFLFGAAPLDPSIRSYFLSLNFYLVNSYGMSESTGPQNFTDKTSLDISSGPDAFREVGRNLPGTELVIKRASPSDEDGEICYRGRNVFMGYFKNPEESAKTLDAEGFLHSGDNGKLTAEGVLFITGRAKELIITAGGENIPPVLIENEIKSALPFLANAMVVGDMKKFLTVLLTLREDPPSSGVLDRVTLSYLEDRGCRAKTVAEARTDEKLRKVISEGLRRANEKAISRAQHVQDFLVVGEDFTVENGLLTPTLKLKRKEVLKKYQDDVEKLYLKPHL